MLKFDSIIIGGVLIKNFYGLVPLNINSRCILIGNDIVMSSSNISIIDNGCILEWFDENKYSKLNRGAYEDGNNLFSSLLVDLFNMTEEYDRIDINKYSLDKIDNNIKEDINKWYNY